MDNAQLINILQKKKRGTLYYNNIKLYISL